MSDSPMSKAYRFFFALATMIFLLVLLLSAVPDVVALEKIVWLAIGAAFLIVSLGIGFWGYKQGQAAIAASRPNAILGALLAVQLACAVAGVVALWTKAGL